MIYSPGFNFSLYDPEESVIAYDGGPDMNDAGKNSTLALFSGVNVASSKILPLIFAITSFASVTKTSTVSEKTSGRFL